MNTGTKKIVTAALLTALTCVATMIIKIPSPLKGYLNIGDCIVLISGWLLSPLYGFLAAGVGSALADVFSGYLTYAPATFVIKGLMALVAYFLFKSIRFKIGDLGSRIISGVAAEIVMISGYFIFESILYGFVPSLVNIPANGVQGAAGIVIGVLIIEILSKIRVKI